MDVLPRITRQLVDQLREMPLAQRVVSIGLVLVVFAGFAGLLFVNQQNPLQPVSFGKAFTNEERSTAEKALKAAGLSGFRRDGQRLLAPEKDLNRYNAALLETDALPTDLGAQMLKQVESLGPFTTDRQRLQMKEALVLQELRRMIKAVPEIEDARVAIASSERRQSWNKKARATANVMLKPRSGREISATLVNSLRQVVASMVPDLDPADVTVFDVTRGQAYTGEPLDDPDEYQLLQRIRETTVQYEQQIKKALSHIPHVGVVVQIDEDEVKSTLARGQSTRFRTETVQLANRPAAIQSLDLHSTGFRGSADQGVDSKTEYSEQALKSAIPGAVQISVSIPRDYLRKVAHHTGQAATNSTTENSAEIEDEVVSKVERIVTSLVPTEATRRGVSITTVDRLDEDAEPLEQSSWETQIRKLSQHWGGPLVLSLLAIVGLWAMVRIGRPATPVIESLDRPAIDRRPIDEMSVAPVPLPATSEVKVTPHDRMALLRDEVRSLVASDPAASAELISKWLCEVRE